MYIYQCHKMNDNVIMQQQNINITILPVWIEWKSWCGRFHSDKPGDVDSSFENASIESKTPRYFIFKLMISIELLSLSRWGCLQAKFSIESLPPRHSRRAFLQLEGLVGPEYNRGPKPSFMDSWPEYSSCSCLPRLPYASSILMSSGAPSLQGQRLQSYRGVKHTKKCFKINAFRSASVSFPFLTFPGHALFSYCFLKGCRQRLPCNPLEKSGIKDQLIKPRRWGIPKIFQHTQKFPNIYQDSNIISKKNNTHKYTKMIKELLWEIGSTNTSLLKNMTYIQDNTWHVPL